MNNGILDILMVGGIGLILFPIVLFLGGALIHTYFDRKEKYVANVVASMIKTIESMGKPQ